MSVIAGNDDPACGQISGCYLVNLETSLRDAGSTQGTLLQSGRATTYDPDASAEGWSIRCPHENGSIEFVKYQIVGGQEYTAYVAPWWIVGDNDGTRVNTLAALSSTGTTTIEVRMFTFYGYDEGDDPTACDTATLVLQGRPGAPPAPVPTTPVPAPREPVPAPTKTSQCPSKSIESVNGFCCPKACGVCGGRNCRRLPLGRDNCCTSAIRDSGRKCSRVSAPCEL